MADWYTRSLAAGTATGADWANAKLTLAAALTAGAAGDSFFVSEDHAETQASAMTLTSPGTVASPCFIYCVNHAGSVPPVSADLATTATISTTGLSSIAFVGSAYYRGITFNAGNAANSAGININSGSAGWHKFESCALVMNNTSLNTMTFGSNTGVQDDKLELVNTTLTFGATGQKASIRQCDFSWKNTASAILGTVPTTLFAPTTTPSLITLQGVDLSAAGSGKTLIGASNCALLAMLEDCKLGASVTVASTPTAPDQKVNLFRCDSGATNYRTESYQYTGTQIIETTIIRTSGASDGTTGISWNLVTTANSKWVLPFEALPIAIWNDTAGSSVTVTLFGVWGGGAVPNNDDIWFDLEYLGSTLTPQGSFATASKADNLATGSALTSDTSTWGGSTTKFKMAITVTPQQKGAMYIYVRAAKVSSTFYIDPKPVLS